MNRLAAVEAFHDKFEIGYRGVPRLPTHDLRMFRLRFLGEELRELGDALGVDVRIEYEPVVPVTALQIDGTQRLSRALDALCDLDYVLLGTVSLLGFSAVYDEGFARVHTANMAKVRGLKPGRAFSDARWDVTKPPGWRAPDHVDLVVTDDARDVAAE